MNYNIRNQGTNTWDGLFSLIGGIMGQNARQRGEAKNYQAQQDFNDQINALDYGGQTHIEDLASRANPNSNYTNKTASTQAMQGLLPTSFNQVPTSDTLGQGLLGQPLNNQQPAQQGNNFEFANPLDKYSKENNPAMVTTSAPKTLREQQSMIKSQIPRAMKELIGKGYNPKDILPLLQQSANDKIAELTASNQEQVINDLYSGFVNEENPNKKAMYAARLKQAGYDVTTAYKEFAPEYKFEKFDNGDINEGYSFNPKTGKLEKQVSLTKGVDPGVKLTNDTKIITTGMNNDTTKYVANLRGSGGMTSTQQRAITDKLNNAKAIMSAYDPNGKQFTDQYGEEGYKPYTTSEQIRFNEAAEYIKAYDQGWGQSEPQPQSQGGNNDGAVWYDQTWQDIKAQNPGMSDQQVSEYMTYIIQQNGG